MTTDDGRIIEDESRPRRIRKPTEKGEAFARQIKSQNCQTVKDRLNKEKRRLESLMVNVENVHTVQNDMETFNQIVDDFQTHCTEWSELLKEEDEKLAAMDWYNEHSDLFKEFQNKASEWITQAKQNIEDQLEKKSHCSSRSSRRSRTSFSSSCAAALVKERAKSAELKAKVSMLERKQALQNEVERLQLEEELVVAHARESVFAQVEQDEIKEEYSVRSHKTQRGEVKRHSSQLSVARSMEELTIRHKVSNDPKMLTTIAKPREPITSTVTATRTIATSQAKENQPISRDHNIATHLGFWSPESFTAQHEFHSVTQGGSQVIPDLNDVHHRDLVRKQNDLMTLMVEQHRQSLVPPLNLAKFSGDPTEYNTFIRGFESQIESRLSSNDTRLRYLEQYLESEPKELIKGCLHVNANQGYFEAKRLLKEKYGDPYQISNAYLKKATDWPNVKAGDEAALDRFSTFLTQCLSAMISLSYLSILDHPHSLQNLVIKLPLYLQDRWRREANKIREIRASTPGLTDFSRFVKSEARVANDPIFSRGSLNRILGQEKPKFKPKYRSSEFISKHTAGATITEDVSQGNQVEDKCILCGGTHNLDECQDFWKKPLEDRKAWLKDKRLCFACYGVGHRAKGCSQRRKCKRCPGKHPTALHDDNFIPKIPRKKPEQTFVKDNSDVSVSKNGCVVTVSDKPSCYTVNGESSLGAMPIVPVKLKANGKEVVTYAMLDNCSTGTFIREDVREELEAVGTETNLVIKTINGSELHSTVVLTDLVVTDLDGNNSVKLPRTYTRKEIPAGEEEIPRPESIRKWRHLERIADKVPAYVSGIKIGLLIGSNFPKAIEPKDFIAANHGGPFAVKTFAGWTVVGPLRLSQEKAQVNCHRVVVKEVDSDQPSQHHFMFENKVKEIMTPKDLNRMLELEFNVRPGDKEHGYSQEYRRFLNKMQTECTLIDGHYQLPLPLRNENVCMPDNREQAVHRMNWLKRKFMNNEKFYNDYVTFMKEILAKDYARKVPQSGGTPDGQRWYIPHHGVYHSKKPEKIRVVFDCSAKYGGTSLNDQLIQGPDLTSSLIGVLTRFRQEPVAFMADIESMFYQVRVPEVQRDLLRFLWWPNGDLTQDFQEYQMNVHLFGAVSSPSCSNFSLNKAAEDSVDEVGVETAEVLKKNFYVDECLRSEKTEDLAMERIKGVRRACAVGGFHLTKFISNNRKVLNTIPEEERSKNVRTLDLNSDQLPIERALGVEWLVESDAFGFRITLKDKPLTRRGILSTVSSIYDPLGMVAPFLLIGKKILQDLCKESIDWDEQISEECRVKWEKWRRELLLLERFESPRCFLPDNFGVVTSRQVHHFSDASFVGYGQVSYLRLVNERNEIYCSFLIGKARVAPTKSVTIPRLELTAATMSVRVGTKLVKELDDSPDKEVYWTDSSTVLQYVNNESRRFQIFVANRVQIIRDSSEPSQWHYVEGRLNPADDASRGLRGGELLSQQRWIKGPDFLWQLENQWPQHQIERNVPQDDPELKRVRVNATVIKERNDIIQRLVYFSDWFRLKSTIAWILRIKPKAKKNHCRKLNDRKCGLRPITIEELKEAEIVILRLVQASSFAEELNVLKEETEISRDKTKRKRPCLKRWSSLYRLDPFLDQDGLVRVGGRLGKMEEFAEEIKHPVILPRKGHFTELIIRNAHERTGHAGRGITLNELRSCYWIPNSNSVVRHFISKCVKCRRLRASGSKQKMADLPKERLIEAPPFTYCGVDYFGPCLIKEGRKELKRYGALFTCLVSRAVHIETANSLETDSFLNALRRFIARRGPVREIRSDQGTNLVGAEKELKLALQEMDSDKITGYLKRNANADWMITWKRNPPAASHMGGVWERQIRTVRSILVALMREHSQMLDDESFRTLLVEVESIVNSRPLTFPSSDVNDLNPLTPSHILTMKSKVVMPPPGNFQRADIYLRKRWRRVQYLANLFWTRWRKEYLHTLQARTKWNHPQRNLEPGDIVLVVNENCARNQWLMARIVSVKADKKLLVRSATIKTASSVLERPISKLILLLENEKDQEDIPVEEPS